MARVFNYEPGVRTPLDVYTGVIPEYEISPKLEIEPDSKISMITDPDEAKKHVLSMVKNQAINCHSGKQIPCEIDSVCIHGDNESSLSTAKSIKTNLMENGLELKPLNAMKKFI